MSRPTCLHDDAYLSAYTKRDLAKFVLDRIDADIDYIVVAGDFNTFTRLAQKTVEREFQEANFVVSTPNVSWTSKHWYLLHKKTKIDHIFSQNMHVIDSGVILNRSVSDHMPIWAELKLDSPQIVSQNEGYSN